MWSVPAVIAAILLFVNTIEASPCQKPHPDEVKGVYLWAKMAENPKTLAQFIRLTETTEINAFVIDANETGNFLQEHNKRILARLAKHCVYTIARIVVFKADASWYAKTGDPMSLQGDTLFLHDTRWQLWRDTLGNPWLNPFNRMSRKIAVEWGEFAAKMGFDEVQFDYVRFPTDARRDQPLSSINYGTARAGGRQKTEAITDFVIKAAPRLRAASARVALDVFGEAAMIGKSYDPADVGQDVASLLPHLDVISPMVYPALWSKGRFGLPIPAQHPYTVVRLGLTPLVRYQRKQHRQVVVRPWIQDFTTKSRGTDVRVPYGAEEVRDQLRALEDLGIKTWMLWNSTNGHERKGNFYTVEALRPHPPAPSPAGRPALAEKK